MKILFIFSKIYFKYCYNITMISIDNSCLILGDSIAVGVSSYTRCQKDFIKSGANTRTITKEFKNQEFKNWVIISSGSNDYRPNSNADLLALRKSVKNAHVVWILPAPQFKVSRGFIKEIAAQFGDRVIEIGGLSSDKVHPTGNGYKQLADDIKRVIEKKG